MEGFLREAELACGLVASLWASPYEESGNRSQGIAWFNPYSVGRGDCSVGSVTNSGKIREGARTGKG